MDTSTKQITCSRSEQWVQATGEQLYDLIITWKEVVLLKEISCKRIVRAKRKCTTLTQTMRKNAESW